MPPTLGKVISININEEMKHSYLDYAMSVIVGRALPDVRDGLKPVHRRILYAMHQLGLTADRPHRKSANIVGAVLSDFHPHGDMAVYDALVRMAQDFASRYPLVDGHGNFGSVDGDPPAAMRYTEARMSRIASEMLADIEKETVDFIPNYDGRTSEPTVLPARIPNLLINGSAGIAVGMATNIPPHNLGEVIDGVIMLIDNPAVTIQEIMRAIKGPDFPTGGKIMGSSGIREAYETGRGTIRVRAQASIEKIGGGKSAIIVHELPFLVNKAKLIEKIAELVREKKIDGITDLRDESDRRGMRVVIELRRDAKPQVILNQLYKHTQMQDTFGVIMLALVGGQPRVLNLKQVLEHYLDHQKEVVTRRTRFDLARAEARAHIVEGLRIALDHIDEVINLIRASRTVEIARQGLMEKFGLSEKQAEAILEMRLQRLTGLERDKLEAEYRELREKIAYLKSVLADEKKILHIIKEEITQIKQKFADARRTVIDEEAKNPEAEDFIPEEEVVITITNQGYIKRMPLDLYRSQKRGGRGVTAMGTKEEDFVRHLFITGTHHYFLFFSNRGKVYRLKVHEIPEAGRQAKGTAIVNLLYIDQEERITAVIPVRDFAKGYYLFMATRNGVVKKTELEHFDTSRRDGIIAINLDEGDELVEVKLTDGGEEIILGTAQGLAIRFPEKEVAPHGRASRGVKGINLQPGDAVVAMDTVRPNGDVLVVMANGYGKRTSLTEYRRQSRGGRGIISARVTGRTGEVIALQVVLPGEEFMAISAEGIIIRLKAGEVSTMGRATQGVTLMRLAPGDKLVSVARVNADE
ncbi:DNA gyrase subunit A [Desulfofundulus thermobenzoicus]|uniref:DNA gyrase subunit A n=1 Tax=Desulfofundulus thermobenzoicus TaxID=29376 RepID=A0A6N7IVP4_9FIRM|nr:DNA gyrase subunit A [Desulfofundulus thermobenzoicus]MQL53208.1 DNA gyrase subunit A [Desulfofundulus thermobenzoicus]